MTSKLEKEKRKALKKRYKDNDKERFLSSLPIPLEVLGELYDWLDKQSETQDCDDTLKQTRVFISRKNLPEKKLIECLENQGGYCDCEVLANVAEQFDELK